MPGKNMGSYTMGIDTIGPREEKELMLEALIVVLVVLWALGFFVVHVTGGLIHALLVLALVVFIVRMLRGRSAVA